MSRAFGDFDYKANMKLEQKNQAVTVFPEVYSTQRQGIDFVLLACDGLWDMKSSEDAVADCHK